MVREYYYGFYSSESYGSGVFLWFPIQLNEKSYMVPNEMHVVPNEMQVDSIEPPKQVPLALVEGRILFVVWPPRNHSTNVSLDPQQLNKNNCYSN